MKTKLLLLIIPVILVFAGSCSGLVEDLIKGEIDEKLILGNWKATEYYSSELNEEFEKDYSKTNLLQKLVTAEKYTAPCTTKMSKIAIKLNALSFNFLKGNVGKQIVDLHHIKNTFDENCKPDDYDHGGLTTHEMKWNFSDSNKRLIIEEVSESRNKFDFQIVEFSENKMELLMDKNGNYLRIVLARD